MSKTMANEKSRQSNQLYLVLGSWPEKSHKKLSLFGVGARFAFVLVDGMKHNLSWVVCIVSAVSFTPIIADSIAKDSTGLIEGGGRDAAADRRVALEAVFSVFVPKVEGPITTSCTEGAMLWMEGYVINRVYVNVVARRRIAMTLEGEVETVT